MLDPLVEGGGDSLPIVSGVNDLRNPRDPCAETDEGDPEAGGAERSEDHREGELASGCANRRLTRGEEEGDACSADKPDVEGPRVDGELFTDGVWCNEDCEKREGAEKGGNADRIKGVPCDCGDVATTESPPRREGTNHHKHGAESAQAPTVASTAQASRPSLESANRLHCLRLAEQ